MTACQRCEQTLLPFLFDLLEADERAEMQTHLAECPACMACLERARVQQALLKEAARESFPEVRFDPKNRPVTTKAAAPPRRRPVSWGRRLLIAASVLFVLVGAAASLGGWRHFRSEHVALAEQQRQALAEMAELQSKINVARQATLKNIRELHASINTTVRDYRQAQEKTRAELQKDQTDLIVTGRPSYQAGAVNRFDIHLRNPRNNANEKATVRVVGEDAKKVLFEKEVPAQGAFNISLPPDLPVATPGKMFLEIADKDGARGVENERVSLSKLRYLTHLATDRPMYRPGETIHFRSLTLERFTLQPAQEDLRVRFRITNPQGTEIFSLEGKPQLVGANGKDTAGPDGRSLRGLAAGQFALPQGTPGGTYALIVSEANNRFPPERRVFTVNQWQSSRLNKELTFHRKSYGPGEQVVVNARGVRVEGEAVAFQNVACEAQVDNMQVVSLNAQTNEEGKVTFSFTLPQVIERGKGSVSLTFFDNAGTRETIVRPVPIIVDKLAIDFYPEGGDLIAGVANRVYFQVRNSLDRPAEMKGRIVDANTREVVAHIETLTDDVEPGINQGMGSFTFVPTIRRRYHLLIDTPTGIKGQHTLPVVRNTGVVLNVSPGVVEESIPVTVTSVGKDRRLLIGAYCRGGLLDQVHTRASADTPTSITLKTTPGISGVHRVTVFEVEGEDNTQQLVPVAERLVYRQQTQKLNIGISPTKKVYQPGEKVEVAFATSDESAKKVPAVLMVAVVDKALLQIADEKTFHSLPTHFLLTSEVRRAEDLEYADFLLGSHAKATQALDLMLGTQGWRRFAEQNPEEFVQKQRIARQPAEAERLLLAMGSQGVETVSLREQALDKVDQDFGGKFVTLQKQLADAEKQQNGPQELRDQHIAATGRVEQLRQSIEDAQYKLEVFEKFLFNLGISTVVIVCILVAIGLVLWGVRRINVGEPGRTPIFLGSAMLGGLVLCSLIGVLYLASNRGFDDDWRWGPRNRVRGMGVPAAAPMPPMVAQADALAAPDAEIQFEVERVPKVAVPQFADDKRDEPAAQFKAPPLELANNKVAKDDIEQAQIGIAEPGAAAGEPGFFAGGMAPPGGPMIAGMPRMFDGEAQLRQQGRFEEILLQKLGRRVRLPIPLKAFVVREYAHHNPRQEDGVRRDFSELLCWQPALVTDGKADIRFDLADSTTRFQILVFGHTLDGRLGANSFEITSRLPVSIEPLVPFEITSGDRVHIPVTLANDSAKRADVQVKLFGKDLAQNNVAKDAVLEAEQRGRLYFPINPTTINGTVKLQFAGRFGNLGGDKVERTMRVVPEGFPIIETHSGLLEKSTRINLARPETWVKDSMRCKLEVFPSVLADLQKGLDALLQEPCGCFEQSSSSNYPNVLILDYLKETQQSRPDVEKRARNLMQSGYGQLTSFECFKPGQTNEKKGYEWFGQTAPPHEALTAYGLLQFKDMSRYYPVDEAMLHRTRDYLLGQRDGTGKFKRNPQAIDTFGRAPGHITDAYIVWALTETGPDELKTELDSLLDRARASRDPYFLALVGLGLLNVNRTQDALEVLQPLVKMQDKDGALQGKETSITGSGSRDLQVETTALAILAWLKANRPDQFQTGLNKAVNWMAKQRSGHGGFGATQSTILALKALVAHTRTARQNIEGGVIQILDGNLARNGIVHRYPSGIQEPIVLDLPVEDFFRQGGTSFVIDHTGPNNFPYTVTLTYSSLKPANAKDCPVHLTTSLSKDSAREGQTVQLSATVENKSGRGQGMAVAIVGLPAGLTLPEDLLQLKDLARWGDDGKKPGVISHFEIRNQGREVVLYWRELAPDAKIDVALDLICRIPGHFRGPASRAYLYYTPDKKFWSEPLTFQIKE